MIPGEIFPAPGEIVLNADATPITLMVANTGDPDHFFQLKNLKSFFCYY